MQPAKSLSRGGEANLATPMALKLCQIMQSYLNTLTLSLPTSSVSTEKWKEDGVNMREEESKADIKIRLCIFIRIYI